MNKKIIILSTLALVGFIDAAYLTIQHYANAIPPCTIHGCETVLSSAYSVVFGLPVALLGVAYYFVLLILYFIYFQKKNTSLLIFTLRLSIVGFLADLWFVSAQAFLIHAWCVYCLLSALMSTLIFILSYWELFHKKNLL